MVDKGSSIIHVTATNEGEKICSKVRPGYATAPFEGGIACIGKRTEMDVLRVVLEMDERPFTYKYLNYM